MSYSARSVLKSASVDQRGLLSYSSTTRDAACATLNQETAHTMYGDEVQYAFSVYIDADDWTNIPEKMVEVSFEDAAGTSTSFMVLGVARMPGSLRRLDLGSLTGP